MSLLKTLAAVAASTLMLAGPALAHPGHSAGQTVIANYPVAAGYGYGNGYGYGSGSVTTTTVQTPVPVTTYQTHYQTVPVQQVHYVQPQQIQVQQPVHTHTHQPVVVHRPIFPYDCICARSATGSRVNVYRVPSRWPGAVEARIGGGGILIDVVSYHQGYWRVSYEDRDKDTPQYGWVRQADLKCKEARSNGVTRPVSPSYYGK